MNLSTDPVNNPMDNLMTVHQNAINSGARGSVGVSLAPGPSSTACDDQFTSEADALRAEVIGNTYLIKHRGALLSCSSSMRDAYSDEKLRADAAEAQVVRLREALNLVIQGLELRARFRGDVEDEVAVLDISDGALETARAALSEQEQER